MDLLGARLKNAGIWRRERESAMRLSMPGMRDTLTVKWSVAERKNSLRKRTITCGHLEDFVDQMLTTDMLSQ